MALEGIFVHVLERTTPLGDLFKALENGALQNQSFHFQHNPSIAFTGSVPYGDICVCVEVILLFIFGDRKRMATLLSCGCWFVG